MMSSTNATSSDFDADAVIIGGGLAGVSAATALERKGHSVVLISAHERHPPDFRAEKMGVDQMQLFERIGLRAAAETVMTPFDGVWTYRFGRIAARARHREYGGDYADLVNALRSAMPESVQSIVGKVVEMETSADRQTVTLSDGRRFSGRLLIVATGLGDIIRRKLGIGRDVHSPSHSLCCGFDLAQTPADFPFPSLVWSDATFDERLSYLTLFPIHGKMRANLFVYRTASEDWTRRFREQPEDGLRKIMPAFEGLFGTLKVSGTVTARPIDMILAQNFERDGVVLIGDAFSTVCPITGTGIDKALTDVDRLCNEYFSRWMASPGMGWNKLAEFYADPVKQARDASALSLSVDARKVKLDPAFYWKLRRLRSKTLGRALTMIKAARARA